MLLTNRADFGSFAAYNGPEDSRLYVTIKNPDETVYIGLSREYNYNGVPEGTGSYQFRIRRASDGATVHGPYTVSLGVENATTWEETVLGPKALTGQGYETTDARFVFQPSQPGDYYIEFNNVTYIGLWDITVGRDGAIVDGRVWSKNWSFRTPTTANQLPECLWDRKFNGELYSYTSDGFVSKIDFNNSGFQGLSFNVAFNQTGPGNTGNLEADRMSVPAQNLTNNLAEHKIFLNEPDPECFPDGLCGGIDSAPTFLCEDNGGFCLPVTVTQPGLVEVVLDFNQNGIYDPDTEDVRLVHNFHPDELSYCVPWDGMKGDGNPVGPGDFVDILLQFSQGVQHWSVYDGEFLKNGFCVEAVRPICGNTFSTNVLYWDDRNIPEESGTGQSKDGRSGCECQEDGCRTWNNFSVGVEDCADVSDDFTSGYGDKNTLNTWWFANVVVAESANVPVILSCEISGESEICTNTSTVLSVDIASAAEVVLIEWYGPDGELISSGDATNTTLEVNTSGTYAVRVENNLGCETTCSHDLEVIVCPVDIELDKSVSNVNPFAGEVITFSIHLINYGPGAATGIDIEDTLPSGFSNPENISHGGEIVGSTIVWGDLSLDVGEELMLSFDVTVDVIGEYINLAEVIATNEEDVDSTPDNGVDTDGDGDVEDDPDDEDDGDGVVVVPQPCEITTVISNIICDPNGTLVDASDDLFTFEVTINGQSVSDGWLATDLAATSGAYGETVQFGPYEIADGPVSFTITDLINSECLAEIDVTPPATCSDQCELYADINNVICLDNGTPSDVSDDIFEFDLTVTGANVSDGWEIVGVATGVFEETVTVGPFPISEGSVDLTIVDAEDATCTLSVTVEPPATCSDLCDISAAVANIQCDPGDTPSLPEDDVFTFDVIVTGFNTGATWTTADGAFAGAYNETVTLGPFPIANGDVSLILIDDTDPNCTVEINAPAPPACSDLCVIEAEVLHVTCQDSGTPSQAFDDVFYFDVVVSGLNNGTEWHTGDADFSGTYEDTVTIGPFLIDDGAVNLTIVDELTATCLTNINVPAPLSCSDVCDISAQVANILCDDNGTPSHPEDDIFTFDVLVTGLNTGDHWTTSDGSFTGTYDETINLGPFPISSGDVTLTIVDSLDPGCVVEITAEAPPACSDLCVTEAEVLNVICQDNGTPSHPEDDIYTFDVVVTGLNTGSTWSTSDGSYGGSYMDTVSFGPFPIADGEVSFSIVDNVDADCTTEINVEAPATCSDLCVIEAEVLNVMCQDSGTPSHPEDDVYTFDVVVTGLNTGSGWSTGDGDGSIAGAYADTVSFGPFPISGGDVSFVIADVIDAGCTTEINVVAPETCSDLCAISAEVFNVLCDDSGTPSHPEDDTYTFEVLVTGLNTGSTWISNLGHIGSYNDTTSIGPLPISEGDITLQVSDIADLECTMEVEISAPPTCSDLCVIDALVENINCDDQGTDDPYDDTFTFDVTVTGLNTANGWTTNEGDTGLYDEVTTMGPYLVADGEVTLTIFDQDSDACQVEVSANVPPIDIICPPDTSSITLERTVHVLSGTLDENDDEFGEDDLLCWFPEDWTAAGHLFDTIGFRTQPDLPDGEVYTFMLFTDMVVEDAQPPLPSPMTDGVAAIFIEDFELFNPCCNVLHHNDLPEEEVLLENPFLNGDDLGLEGMDPVGRFSLRLRPGQLYTLLVSTWNPNITGNYAWVVLTESGDFNVDYYLQDEQLNEVTANVTFDLLCDDVPNILNIPESTDLTGNASPASTCGFDFIDFSDELNDEYCEDKYIERTFTLHDVQGRTTECTQTITFRVASLSDVRFPPLRALFNSDLSFEVDDSGHPHPSESGYPFVWTAFGSYDINIEYCNLRGTYKDIELGGCGNAYEILRQWTIVDVCTDEVVVYDQLIKVCVSAPVVECPLSNHYCPILENNIMLFSADPYTCTGTVEIPVPNVQDSCDQWQLVTEVLTADGMPLDTLYPGDSRVFTALPLGDYIIRYAVTDVCGGSSVIECLFRVADLSEPTAICDANYTAYLDETGTATVYTTDIDEGSYDNCGIDSILLRRVYRIDPVTCDSLDTPYYSPWADFIEVNCCDAGYLVTVEMKVVDINGNVNTCWLDMEVEDPVLPTITNIADITQTCDDFAADFDPYNMEQLNALFGAPGVMDNCGAYALALPPEVALSDCLAGTITRRFVAVDTRGNISADTIVQQIVITNEMNYAVRFPMDVETDCGNFIDTLAIGGGCGLTVSSYEDDFAPADGEACYVLARTYYVINWCEYDGMADPLVIDRDEDCDGLQGEEATWVVVDGELAYVDRDSLPQNDLPAAGIKGMDCDQTSNPEGYWRTLSSIGYWQYTQLIRFVDNTAPVVHFELPDAFCSTDSINCTGFVEYPFEIVESCVLDSIESIELFLDENADGSLDMELPVGNYLTGTYPAFTINGDFVIGTHRFVVQITDGCGNTGQGNLDFEVVDCVIPELVCYAGIIYNLAAIPPETDADNDGDLDKGAVEIFAVDLAQVNGLECSGPVQLSINRVGEAPVPTQESLIITCDERFMVDVEVYVWDQAYNPYAVQPDSTLGGANYQMCETTVFIQDPDEVCPDCIPEFDPSGELVELNCDDEVEEVPTPDDDHIRKQLGGKGTGFRLLQNKPNPFADQTVIPFEIEQAADVCLIIHNFNGRIIHRENKAFAAGRNEWKLNRNDWPSGVLYYTIQTGNNRATRKMIVVK